MTEENKNESNDKQSKAVMTDAEMQKVVETTAQALKKQKKVRVKIYLHPDEIRKLEAIAASGKKVEWPYETVQINGYTYQIQLGKEVEVPEEVANILSRAGLA